MIGTCRLCQAPGVKLRDSHYLPKGIYRELRDDAVAKPHPFSITDKATVQTSRQLRAHLLCDSCEGRLSKLGEDWVLKHMRRSNGQFKLATMLDARAPLAALSDDPTRVYLGGDIPGIDTSALAYFAASVFWRGTLHPWNHDGTTPVDLGVHAEEFRSYLDETAGFPPHAALLVSVREDSEVSMMTAPPFGREMIGFHEYNFFIPGLAFVISVGQEISELKKRYCFVRGIGHPMARTSRIDPHLESVARRLHEENRARKR